MLECILLKILNVYSFVLKFVKIQTNYFFHFSYKKYHRETDTLNFNSIFEKECVNYALKLIFIFTSLSCLINFFCINSKKFYFYSNALIEINDKFDLLLFEIYGLLFKNFVNEYNNSNNLIRLFKMCLLNIYINFNFNIFFLLTFLFIYVYIVSTVYKKFMYKLFFNENVLYYKNKKNYNFYFIFNFILFLIFFVFYKIYLFNNNFNNSIFIFHKKLKLLNVNLLYTFNLDFINFYFIFLTIFIFFIIYFTFFNLKFKNDVDFKHMKIVLFLFLLIEILLILTFSTSNFLFFFIFFEISLMPLYFLILMLGKGGKKKHFAAFALVFYTLFGSIFLLFGIIYLNVISNTLDFKSLSFEVIDFNSQLFLFFLFFVGFSVKVPIFPFYSWLPEAHVEASTSLSILLASIFLKIATYAFLKIIIFNMHEANVYFFKFILFFSVVSILLASFLSLTVSDLKKIIALSSIIHMNYIIISLFSLKSKLIFASLLYMFSHAFVSSGLFYMIGILYENNNTRNLINYNRSFNYNSKFFFFFFFFNLSNISFPLTMAFVAELLIINNLASVSIILLIVILISTLFSTIYTFFILHNVLFGKFFLKKNFYFLTKFDFFFLFILFLIIVVLGLFTNICLYNLEQEIYLIIQKKIDTF